MQDLMDLLKELEIPVAYDHFNTAIEPPCIVYRRISTDNFSADNKVYKKIEQFYVELYTEFKDVSKETALEDLFEESDIFWNVESEDYIDTEKMYQVIYSINIEGGTFDGEQG